MTHTPRADPDDALRQLLTSAGPRSGAPAEVDARVRAATEGAWTDVVYTRRQRRLRLSRQWIGAAAAAATIVGAASVWQHTRTADPPSALPLALREVVATIEHATGPIELGADDDLRPGETATALGVGDEVRAGAVLRTSHHGRAALRLRTGVALRLDIDTVIRAERAGEIVLEAGALYADTGVDAGTAARADAGSGAAALRIYTLYGVATDIGTRFEVRLLDHAVRVRVRDGIVRLQQGPRSHRVEKGVEIVSDSGGQAERRLVLLSGEAWEWVSQAAPPVTIDGETLATFLDWASREGGWSVRFDDLQLAEAARTTTVHGAIDGLTPEESLTAVLTTCGLRYQLRDGIVIVSAARP